MLVMLVILMLVLTNLPAASRILACLKLVCQIFIDDCNCNRNDILQTSTKNNKLQVL